MNERENNEIDSLLRGLAQRDRLSMNAASGELAAETASHLDADEMSAYAERALPEAARARYTAHLADCGDCRQLVAQLSVAVGLPAPESTKETVATGWKQKVAALLQPGAWRYAMPALVLLAVVAVGFFTLRQKRETDFVAQRAQPVAAPANTEPSGAAPASGGTQSAINPEHAAPPKHSPTPAANSRSDAAGAPADANATPVVALADDKDSGKARGEAGGGQPAPANAAAPPAPPANKTSTAQAPAKSADEIRTEEAVVASKKKEAERKSAAGTAGANVESPRRVVEDGPQTGRSREQQAETRDARAARQEVDTRAVAGHRFTRKNGVWVDATFDSSRSPIVVTRGSEQYRALIADEPGIRTIAEQLSGVVLVVWNGHAYRIQ